jgi:uncharacterized membrane protein YadS
MTPNIASPVYNTLVVAFFAVILIGMALGAYAAMQLGKAQKAAAQAGAGTPITGAAAAVAVKDTAVED